MDTMRRLVVVFAVVCVIVPSASLGQGGPPPIPKPGPEHKLLLEDEGVWDAAVEIFPGPGAPAMTSKGVETNTVGCGGLCLITDFKGEMAPGQPYHGHGIATWDASKKKYVGGWTDSMSGILQVGESTYDPATRTVTGSMTGPDASGAMVTMRSVVEYKGGQRVFNLYAPGPDGKEVATMRITYTKRK
jgi:hypothetical protein